MRREDAVLPGLGEEPRALPGRGPNRKSKCHWASSLPQLKRQARLDEPRRDAPVRTPSGRGNSLIETHAARPRIGDEPSRLRPRQVGSLPHGRGQAASTEAGWKPTPRPRPGRLGERAMEAASAVDARIVKLRRWGMRQSHSTRCRPRGGIRSPRLFEEPDHVVERAGPGIGAVAVVEHGQARVLGNAIAVEALDLAESFG